MKNSIILTEIQEMNDKFDENTKELKYAIKQFQNEKDIKIDNIMKKCNHFYDDGTTSLVANNRNYECRICNSIFPLETVIGNYIFINKKIESIPNSKLSENLKQLIDIIISDRNYIDMVLSPYEKYFEYQCNKQYYSPKDIFVLLCDYKILEPNGKRYVEVIR